MAPEKGEQVHMENVSENKNPRFAYIGFGMYFVACSQGMHSHTISVRFLLFFYKHIRLSQKCMSHALVLHDPIVI